jgi:two-component system, OmpR family, heavy metal sensor histidine kinase CusS
LRSLRGRLIVWLLAGIGLLLTAAGLFLDRAIGSRLRQGFDAGLIAEARSVMAVTEQQDGRVALELSPGLMPEFESARRPDYFQLWVEGRVLARSPSLAGRDLPRPASPSRRFRFDDLTLPDGRRGRRVEITFHPQTEPDDERKAGPSAGAGSSATLVVARGSEELDAFLASLHRTLALFILGLLLGSALLVRAVTAYALRPLDNLARRLEAIDAGSLREAVVIDGAPTELIPTIEHLNGLLARLAESFERERTFSANLAHELRTPLAELRAVTDVALKWPDDPASLLAALGEARGSGLQMEKIVVNLLALARYDGGQHTLHLSKVPLRETVDACWRAAAAEAEGRGLTAALEIPEGLTLVTDQEKLELILSNLLANAVAYGSPGGRITCAVSASEGRFTLSVVNPTTELDPGELSRIFDRFWRRDTARSDGRHMGLGLSLVAALCELLGFSKEARLHDGIFEIVLSGAVGGPGAGTAIPKGDAFFPVSS